MASTKRQAPAEDEPDSSKKPRPEPKPRMLLNSVDCDLDFNIDGNGLQGSSLYEQGFAYCWSGARANVGISGGKYCFGCRLVSYQPVEMEDTAAEQRNLCRVGISRGGDVVGGLGETKLSFGYGGTGKFSNASRFSDYGERFGLGDVIVCAVDLEEKPLASIGFSKNGKSLGAAARFDAGGLGIGVVDCEGKRLDWECGVFPHVLLKNVGVEMMFSVEDGLVPEEGFKAWECAVEDGNSVMGPAVCEPEDCEVMMMVGLPASGKTTWAERWVKEHPEKRYVVLGTNMILDQMKVPGLLRKQNYGERFERLMSRATQIFNTLLSRAATTPRNYILDQTNVYKNARKRKLLPFKLFKKIAVVVFPSPEEVKARSMKRFREMGKEVPADAVNEMLANYVLPVSRDMPRSDELFDEVMFVELNREESQRHLDEMKQELARASSLKSNNSSPYTCGNSVQSYPCSPSYGVSPVRPYPTPSPQYQGVSAVNTGNWNSSYSSVPPPYYHSHMSNQVDSYQTHQGVVPVGTAGSYQGHQPPPVPRAVTPQGAYSGYSSTYNATPASGTSPYNSYGAGYGNATNHYPSSVVQPSLVGGAVASFTGNVPGCYGGAGYSSHAAPHAPRAPAYHPSPCPPAYGGSPYGTTPPRPQSGSFHVNTPYPDGYAPPGSGYY
uniref:heterogeneous nuclear ribonucleoprotein U-like protein 1 n=1 Tax=Fragaria vesca subsp. vesca TaxID=101020 RepID=UPI0005C8885C|nr:PREDICTED: heterogeneous nuclear ribonucleoprotein U-like protein 1 [Fragaria vesca subsp. vesca]